MPEVQAPHPFGGCSIVPCFSFAHREASASIKRFSSQTRIRNQFLPPPRSFRGFLFFSTAIFFFPLAAQPRAQIDDAPYNGSIPVLQASARSHGDGALGILCLFDLLGVRQRTWAVELRRVPGCAWCIRSSCRMLGLFREAFPFSSFDFLRVSLTDFSPMNFVATS